MIHLMSHFTPELSPALQQRLANGISIDRWWWLTSQKNSGTPGQPKLRWGTFEKDAMVIGSISSQIEETAHHPDQVFRGQQHDLHRQLLDAPLFKALNSRRLKVTPAHQGTTPAQHTINASSLTETTLAMSDYQRQIIREGIMLHDIGKVATGDKDYGHDHPKLGALMVAQIGQGLGWGEKHLTDLCQVIQLHHLFEWLEYFKDDLCLLKQILEKPDQAVGLVSVALADVLSVSQYQVHATSIFKWLANAQFLNNHQLWTSANINETDLFGQGFEIEYSPLLAALVFYYLSNLWT